MVILHQRCFLSIRVLTLSLIIACLLSAFGVVPANADSTRDQVQSAWEGLRSAACTNARNVDASAEDADNQHEQMEQTLREAEELESVNEDVLRDSTRSMENALRDMRGIARDLRRISKDMQRICNEDLVLHNLRDVARKYKARRRELNSAGKRFEKLRDKYNTAIKDFNQAATDLAVHGAAMDQLEIQ